MATPHPALIVYGSSSENTGPPSPDDAPDNWTAGRQRPDPYPADAQEAQPHRRRHTFPPPTAKPIVGPVAGPVTRRSVLHGALLGGATLAVVGTGALSYRVFDTAVLDPHHGHAFDAWGAWRDDPGPLGTVAAAILAANPHNTQPWTFRVGLVGVDVLRDPARRVRALDPFERETHVGLGCAIENLVLAGQARGLDPVVDLVPDGPTGERVARVRFGAGPASPSASYDAIGRRHSNRGPYTAAPVPGPLLGRLSDATGLDGVSVRWITGPAEVDTLGRLMIDAAVAVTRDGAQSREGFAWFRSSDDEIQRHRDGLTLDGQGLAEAVLTAAKLLPASSRSAGDDFWVTQTREVHTRTAAAYGVIVAPSPRDPTTALTGGRLLQRIHLRATAAGVALQHMNQVTERIDRERQRGATSTLGPRLAALLAEGDEPLVTFRVGYAVRPGRLSPRRALAQVT